MADRTDTARRRENAGAAKLLSVTAHPASIAIGGDLESPSRLSLRLVSLLLQRAL